MAFSDFVSRVFGKRPVWLYRLTINGVPYHYSSKGGGYTTVNNSPSLDFPTGQIWSHSPIQRGEIFQTSMANRSDTWIRLPTLNPMIAEIIASDDTSNVSVDIWQGFVGDPDNEFVLQFTGRVVEVEPALLLTTLICETSISEANRSSVAQVVQRSCRHAHYFTNSDGGGCRLNLADFQVSAEVTIVESRTLTVPEAANSPDGTYLAGILEYDGQLHMIQSHVGDLLTLENSVSGLAEAVALGTTNVLIAPGCDLTTPTCNGFGNIANFGGFNDMDASEFDGRSIA